MSSKYTCPNGRLIENVFPLTLILISTLTPILTLTLTLILKYKKLFGKTK